MRKKIFILTLIMLIMSFANIQITEACSDCGYADNGEVSFSSKYYLTANEDGSVNLKIDSRIVNHHRVYRHLLSHSQDGSDYYICTGYNSDPRVIGYENVGYGIRFTEHNDENVRTTTATLSRRNFNSYFNRTTTVPTPSKNVTETSVEFEGVSQITHYAYIFGTWMHYGDKFTDIDEFNDGQAYDTACADECTSYYKVNDGSWTAIDGTSKTFYFDDYNHGDTIYFYTVSTLGYTSEVVSYTIKKEYTLTFDPNEGSLKNPGGNLYNGTNTNSVTVIKGSANYYSMSGDIPTRTGYEFTGWYTESVDGTQVYTANGVCANEGTYWKDNKWVYTNNKTLYAHWEPKTVSLTFNPNGGVLKNPGANLYNETNTNSVAVTYNSSNYYLMTDDIPTRVGILHTDKNNGFLGWYTEKTKGTQIYNYEGKAQSVTGYFLNNKWNGLENKTVYAQWNESTKLTINYNANGGDWNGKTTKKQELKYYAEDVNTSTNQTYISHLNYNNIGTSENEIPTRIGYVFKGWGTIKDEYNVNYAVGTKFESQTVGEFANENDASIDKENNSITLYAQWEKEITYKFNYYNTSKSVKVCYYNNDTTAIISNFINGNAYKGTGKNTTISVDDENATVSLSDDITSNKTIGGYLWNVNALSKSNDSTASRYNNAGENTASIKVNVNDADSGETVNFYTSYYRHPKITLIDYGNNKQIKRYISKDNNNSYITNNLIVEINDKRTVQDNYSIYAQYNGTIQHFVTINLPALNKMSYLEKNSKNEDVNESWDSIGWSLKTDYNFDSDDKKENATYATSKDDVWYGLYQKDFNWTIDANGGSIEQTTYPITRKANAYNVKNSSKPEIIAKYPVYKNNNGILYSFVTFTHTQLGLNGTLLSGSSTTPTGDPFTNNQIYNGYILKNYMTESAYAGTEDKSSTIKTDLNIFGYIPLVNETVYASYTNGSGSTTIEPNITVDKKAEWYKPKESDTGTYDFDALGDINLEGIVKVTLTIEITNPSGINADNIIVTDYFNANIWDYYNNISHSASANMGKYSFTHSGNKLVLSNFAEKSSGTFTLTYYLKLKEAYWTKDASGDCKYIDDEIGVIKSDSNGSMYSTLKNDKLYYKYYINKIPTGDLESYLTDDLYYTESKEARQSYVWVDYNINGGLFNNEHRQIHNKTPYIEVRQINRIPEFPTSDNMGITIQGSELNTQDKSATNKKVSNIYKDYSSTYKNTYFVKYNTKNDYISYFDIYMASQLTKSYTYYQISNNLFDIVASSIQKEQVVDNQIAVSATKNNTSVLFKENIAGETDTSKKVNTDILNYKHLRSRFSAKVSLPVLKSKTIHSSVNTNGIMYENAAASTKATLHAINQDNLHVSIYPFVKTTNTKTGISYSTSDRIKSTQRLDLIIDATEPVITADSDLISANGSDKTTWNAYSQYCKDNNINSDGYIDVNLIDKSTLSTDRVESAGENSYQYTFTVYDAISGISNPANNDNDWIDTIHDNIQVTLTRVDDSKVLFNSANDKNYNSKYIDIAYKDESSTSINKDANITINLDGTDSDMWGHLQLKIRVYDNVFNYTDKVYDFYIFNFTANVSIVDTLINSDPVRGNNPSEFKNGEQGQVNISANGFIDRVTVKFDENLNSEYLRDYNKFYKKFANDFPKTINGNYPETDYESKYYNSENDPYKTKLLYSTIDGKPILPIGCQQVYWGYENEKLGGLILSQVKTSTESNIVISTSEIPLQKTLATLIERYIRINNFSENYETITGEHNGYKYAIENSTLYINPVYNPDGSIQTGEQKIYISDSECLYGVDYVPTKISIDGLVSITCSYGNANVEDTSIMENVIKALTNSASIQNNVTYPKETTNWVQTGIGNQKPLIHYFYVPLQAQTGTHEIILTAYQASETGYPHKAMIKLTFSNGTNESTILDDIYTSILDN